MSLFLSSLAVSTIPPAHLRSFPRHQISPSSPATASTRTHTPHDPVYALLESQSPPARARSRRAHRRHNHHSHPHPMRCRSPHTTAHVHATAHVISLPRHHPPRPPPTPHRPAAVGLLPSRHLPRHKPSPGFPAATCCGHPPWFNLGRLLQVCLGCRLQAIWSPTVPHAWPLTSDRNAHTATRNRTAHAQVSRAVSPLTSRRPDRVHRGRATVTPAPREQARP